MEVFLLSEVRTHCVAVSTIDMRRAWNRWILDTISSTVARAKLSDTRRIAKVTPTTTRKKHSRDDPVEFEDTMMTPFDRMCRIDTLLSHVWMVRAFLKHSEEATEDEDLQEVHRELYDNMLALGQSWKDQDAAAYLKQAHKKYRKLRDAAARFREIQPEVSSHTNFQMATQSLSAAVEEIGRLLDDSAGKS
jgi:hypothetical protein